MSGWAIVGQSSAFVAVAFASKVPTDSSTITDQTLVSAGVLVGAVSLAVYATMRAVRMFDATTYQIKENTQSIKEDREHHRQAVKRLEENIVSKIDRIEEEVAGIKEAINDRTA
jgi:alpha-L-arabinofuranosidase